MTKRKCKVVKEYNLLIDDQSDQFVAASERLKEFVERWQYDPAVRRHSSGREGWYTVTKTSDPDGSVDVIFFGIFRSGVYGYCTCDTCQEKETICAHIVAALPVYVAERCAVKCSTCHIYRLPEDLAGDQSCLACAFDQAQKVEVLSC